MRRIAIGVCSLVLAVLLLIPKSTAAETPVYPANPAVVARFAKLPLSFEANHGQSDSRVKFLSRGAGATLYLTATDATIVLSRSKLSDSRTRTASASGKASLDSVGAGNVDQRVVRTRFIGANPAARIEGIDRLAGASNYFIGGEKSKWRTSIPNYAKVRYHSLYPGIDLVYYGTQGHLEFDVITAPGADPSRFRLAVDGIDKSEINSVGDLVIHAGADQIVFHKPVAYQETTQGRQPVTADFKLRSSNNVAFEVGSYDRRAPLVIDPSLVYSTYLGGSDTDGALGIAVDSSGNAYVTGGTESTNFPTTVGVYQSAISGSENVFIAKLNSTGTALLYSTYLGSNDHGQGQGIAIDSSGNAYVTGRTQGNFPTTTGAFQSAFGGGTYTPFITKLNSTGSALLYSTYLGGSGEGFGIAVDSSLNAYVTGYTDSASFPTTAGAFQSALGGPQDTFVAKLNSTGTSLLYSTYLGGSGLDRAQGIAVDSSGNVDVTGFTSSTDFPATTGAFQSAHGGGTWDVFITKLNSTGTALLYSTYLGGSGDDLGTGIALDSSGNAYVTGFTGSGTSFPISTGAFQSAYAGGGNDAFITKLNSTGTALLYSTFLGGSGDDQGYGIAVDSSGDAYVTGITRSADFPTTTDAFQSVSGGDPFDAFITKLNSSGTAQLYSTYLGGSGGDYGEGIAVDFFSNAYVTGVTASADFPTTPGALQSAFGGGSEEFESPFVRGSGDAFVAKIGSEGPPPNCNTISISGSMEGNLPIAPGSTVQAGYDFTMPGSHPDAHVTFANGIVTVQVTCPDNSVQPLTINLPTQVYDDPQNSSAWLPSGDQSSSLVYQGSTISTVCGTQTGHAPKGATFAAQVCSDDAVNKVNVRFHYRDNSSGGWSGTKSVTP